MKIKNVSIATHQANVKALNNVKALKKARLLKNLSRKDLALRLKVTFKAIEQVENGRNKLSEIRLKKYLEALEITKDEFLKLKRDKKITVTTRAKNVNCLSDRRSYKKIINKEVRVIKTLRKITNLSQDEASKVCGYSRPTFGHIENGRIVLNKARIEHILKCLGFRLNDFEKYMGSENLRDEVLEYCFDKMKELKDDKIILLKGIIDSISTKV